MSSISSSTSASSLYPNQNQTAINQFLKNWNSIGSALDSGDISSAQSALSAFQQSATSAQGTSQSSSSEPFGSNTKANADYQTLSTAIQSGDLSGAQAAFKNLQSDLKTGKTGGGHHRHHSGGAPSASSTATSSTTSTTNSSSSAAGTTKSTLAATAAATDNDGDSDGSGALNALA